MKNLRGLLVVAVALGVLTAVPVYAGHTGQQNVAATVTPSFVSVTVSPNSISYGSLNLGAVAEPTLQACAQAIPNFSATNNGSGPEAFSIRGDHSFQTDTDPVATGNQPGTPGSAGSGWDLTSLAGTNLYEHRFTNISGGLTGACDFAGTVANPEGTFDGPLTVANQPLNTKVAVNEPKPVWLRLGMPADTTKGTSQQTMPVIVVATAF